MNNSELLKQIIESRKSTFPKDYTSEEIPQDLLNEILNSAQFVPSHKKTKPARFIVFRGDEKQRLGEKLASIYKETTAPETFLEKKFQDIPAKIALADTALAVCVNFSGLVPEWEEIASTAMAVQNMYLTCTVNQVGCYWSTPGMKDHLNEFLSLEENQKCYGLFYMGMIE